jgi:hypothetical protein
MFKCRICGEDLTDSVIAERDASTTVVRKAQTREAAQSGWTVFVTCSNDHANVFAGT